MSRAIVALRLDFIKDEIDPAIRLYQKQIEVLTSQFAIAEGYLAVYLSLIYYSWSKSSETRYHPWELVRPYIWLCDAMDPAFEVAEVIFRQVSPKYVKRS